jgi:hypothetical protein
MTDRGSEAAARLGIREQAGLPAGCMLGYDSDVPRPTVFITAPGGAIYLHCDLASNYPGATRAGAVLPCWISTHRPDNGEGCTVGAAGRRCHTR